MLRDEHYKCMRKVFKNSSKNSLSDILLQRLGLLKNLISLVYIFKMASEAEVTGVPCQDYLKYCIEPDSSCKDFIMQQTMMRVKDPGRSLRFYTEVLGMRSARVSPPAISKLANTIFIIVRLLKRLDFPSMKFTLYFLGYEKKEDIPEDEADRTRWTFSRKATIELTQ